MRLIRIIPLLILLLYIRPINSVSCDCHPGGVENRVCLFTDPSNIQLSGDTFDFDIKIRNFFRTSSGAAITDIRASVVSCSKQGGGSCSWTGSSPDFSITINPDYIARSVGGDYGTCGTSPDACRTCNTGRVEIVNTQVRINNAADGTYTVRFRVNWQPRNLERFIDVTVSFTSSGGGCTSNSECSDGNPCTNDICSGGSCSNPKVSDGTSCNNGRCCNGVCDTTTGNTNYDSDCRSGPICIGSSWEYSPTNNGQLCGGTACRECSGGYCSVDDDSRCSVNEYCSSGTCFSSGCTSDYDCSDSTPYCRASTGQCVDCLQTSHCDDGNSCTSDLCYVFACTHTNVPDGSTCPGGGCCSGVCDTTIGNSYYHTDCRSGPSCSGTSWQYTTSNDGQLCGGYDCRECNSGLCSNDDDSRCDYNEYCSSGTCYSSGCTSDSDCSGSTPYCKTTTGDCVECFQFSHCDDSNPCTSDLCYIFTCSHTNIPDGSTCSGGYCCSGVCDTTTGNTNYHADCRSGLTCIGTSWEYSITNNGELCGNSECRECSNGICSVDDDTRCNANEYCSFGQCLGGGCSSNIDCSGNTPHCNTANGQCVECLQNSICDDGNSCTTDTCSGNSCTNTNLLDGTSCSGGYCCSGVCDTTTGNTNYHADCRSGLTCIGTSWEYSIFNNGQLCDGTDCRECTNGYCVYDNNNKCNAGESCNQGVCELECQNECTTQGITQCLHNSVMVCGNFDTDTCLEWGNISACNDNNLCTIDTCSGGICSSIHLVDGTSCPGGYCCSGVCDTSTSNTEYHIDCRGMPKCVGQSWEFSIANNGQLCSNYECRQCYDGYCTFDNSSKCESYESCNIGVCDMGCVDTCNVEGETQCLGNSVQLCGNYDSDPCLEWGNTTACNDDNPCTTDSCTTNNCINEIILECGSDDSCAPDWQCSDWIPKICPISSIQTRDCYDSSNCDTDHEKPSTSRKCSYLGTEDQNVTPTIGDRPDESNATKTELEEKESDLIEHKKVMTQETVLVSILIILLLTVTIIILHKYRIHKSYNIEIKKLKDYVEECLEKGENIENVKLRLLNLGWAPSKIEKVLHDVHMMIHEVHKPHEDVSKLVDYINQMKNHGFEYNAIKDNLKRVGWDDNAINEAFKEIS